MTDRQVVEAITPTSGFCINPRPKPSGVVVELAKQTERALEGDSHDVSVPASLSRQIVDTQATRLPS